MEDFFVYKWKEDFDQHYDLDDEKVRRIVLFTAFWLIFATCAQGCVSFSIPVMTCSRTVERFTAEENLKTILLVRYTPTMSGLQQGSSVGERQQYEFAYNADLSTREIRWEGTEHVCNSEYTDSLAFVSSLDPWAGISPPELISNVDPGFSCCLLLYHWHNHTAPGTLRHTGLACHRNKHQRSENLRQQDSISQMLLKPIWLSPPSSLHRLPYMAEGFIRESGFGMWV
eukprot:768800-Hanusia_phi.AAC.7